MDFSSAIQKFKQFKREIDSTSLAVVMSYNPIVDKLHHKCEVLMQNTYTNTVSIFGGNSLDRELNNLKSNTKGYNDGHRLTLLSDLVELIILDLEQKQQNETSREQKEVEKLHEVIRSLRSKLDNYEQVEKYHQRTIEELQNRQKERMESSLQAQSRRLLQEAAILADSHKETVTRLKRYLSVATVLLVSVINLTLPFIFQTSNWMATGIAQALIIAGFAWIYFRPKIEMSDFLKQLAIATISSIIAGVVAGVVLAEMGIG